MPSHQQNDPEGSSRESGQCSSYCTARPEKRTRRLRKPNRRVIRFIETCLCYPVRHVFQHMHQIKDTLRATVRIGYDGRVHKTFRGPKAEERFANEVRVLRHLEKRMCPFVPRLLEEDPQTSKCHDQLRKPRRASRRGARQRTFRGTGRLWRTARGRRYAECYVPPIRWPLLLDRFRVFNDPSRLRRTDAWISNAKSRLTSSGSG